MKKNNNSRLRIGLDGTTLQPERSGVGFYTEHLFASLLAVDGKNEYVVLSNSEVRSDMIPADLVHEGYRFPVRGNLDADHSPPPPQQEKGRCLPLHQLHFAPLVQLPHSRHLPRHDRLSFTPILSMEEALTA